MRILALDTTTRAGSCALLRDGALVREETGDADRSTASRLPGDLMMLLAHTGVLLSEVDAFAVAVGPGSFTGLRVGIATMQGLAFASGRPLVGVSALDALAASVDAPDVLTWVDAWRGEVYSARYGRGIEVEAPTVSAPERLLEPLGDGTWTFIGDGAHTYRQLIESRLGNRARVAEPTTPPLAGVIARLAAVRLAAGERPAPHAIRPLYVRRPDAALAREAGAPRGATP